MAAGVGWGALAEGGWGREGEARAWAEEEAA